MGIVKVLVCEADDLSEPCGRPLGFSDPDHMDWYVGDAQWIEFKS